MCTNYELTRNGHMKQAKKLSRWAMMTPESQKYMAWYAERYWVRVRIEAREMEEQSGETKK